MWIKESICIFGCGKTAQLFCQQYGSRLKICSIMSNNPKEKTFKTAEDSVYEVRRPEYKKGEQPYIIICSNDYENIDEQLMLLGYTPFSDFVDYELASIFLEEKKLVLLYGFCHLRGIKDYLNVSEEFKKNYTAMYYPNYLFRNAYQQEKLEYMIDHCYVFIYGMAVSPDNHYKNQAILDRLSSKVVKMCLQAVYFGAYFPQKERIYNAMNPYAIKCDGYDYTPFSYADSWLNECISKGMSADQVLTYISQSEVYEEDYVLAYLNEEWKRLRFQEEQSDFKILDFIEENYRKKRLFRNEAHMENCVLRQYAFQVMERLNCMQELPVVQEPLLKCSQHCIYPSVAKQLQLEWNVLEEVLDLYTYHGWRKLTFQEYISKYIEVCSTIKGLKKKYFLP